jgi:arylsulfatase A-like enzyme
VHAVAALTSDGAHRGVLSHSAMDRPYRAGLRLGVGAGLGAALILGGVDVALAAGKADGLGFAPAVLALWGVLGLLVGLGIGVIAGAINATWGDEAIRRGVAQLRADREHDVTYAAALLAGALALVVLALVVSRLAVPLVAGVQRQAVGALLLGVLVAAVVPVLALVALPLFRATRAFTSRLPALGTTPRTVGLLVLGPVTITGAALFFVFTRLDWRALGIGSLVAVIALPLLALALAGIARGPLHRALGRWGSRGWVVVAGAVIAAALPALTLRGQPSREAEIAVTEHTLIGPRTIPLLRKVFDADGDGFSNFFSATQSDCNDADRAINPGAEEIAGNGIDDNCEGGDRAATATGPEPTPTGPTPDAAPTPPTPAADRAIKFDGNVLFIMVDTLRADRLGVAGYKRDGKSLTPVLDKLVGESVWFSRAYAQSPNTPRSVPSFMASRYPSQVKVDPSLDANYPTVLDDNVLLFEALKPAGMRTIGITSHFYFCDPVRRPTECAGFKKKKNSNIGQGVDEWDNTGVVDVAGSNKQIASPELVPRAIAKLDALAKAKQRFAMFVHLFEPHSTYMEHPGFPITEKGTAGLIQKYDYEIAFVDGWIGKLLDGLDAAGLRDSTMVVVMADHGEAFGVHSFAGETMFFHGQTLYDELLRVPMLVRVPGVAPRAYDGVVQLIDLAPTITDVLGIARPAPWVGRSLVPVLTGAELPPAPAFAELLSAPSWPHKAKAMITADGAWKLFYRQDDRRYELYDLTKDPQERKDLFTAQKPVADKLTKQLLDWIEVDLPKPPGG